MKSKKFQFINAISKNQSTTSSSSKKSLPPSTIAINLYQLLCTDYKDSIHSFLEHLQSNPSQCMIWVHELWQQQFSQFSTSQFFSTWIALAIHSISFPSSHSFISIFIQSIRELELNQQFSRLIFLQHFCNESPSHISFYFECLIQFIEEQLFTIQTLFSSFSNNMVLIHLMSQLIQNSNNNTKNTHLIQSFWNHLFSLSKPIFQTWLFSLHQWKSVSIKNDEFIVYESLFQISSIENDMLCNEILFLLSSSTNSYSQLVTTYLEGYSLQSSLPSHFHSLLQLLISKLIDKNGFDFFFNNYFFRLLRSFQFDFSFFIPFVIKCSLQITNWEHYFQLLQKEVMTTNNSQGVVLLCSMTRWLPNSTSFDQFVKSILVKYPSHTNLLFSVLNQLIEYDSIHYLKCMLSFLLSNPKYETQFSLCKDYKQQLQIKLSSLQIPIDQYSLKYSIKEVQQQQQEQEFSSSMEQVIEQFSKQKSILLQQISQLKKSKPKQWFISEFIPQLCSVKVSKELEQFKWQLMDSMVQQQWITNTLVEKCKQELQQSTISTTTSCWNKFETITNELLFHMDHHSITHTMIEHWNDTVLCFDSEEWITCQPLLHTLLQHLFDYFFFHCTTPQEQVHCIQFYLDHFALTLSAYVYDTWYTILIQQFSIQNNESRLLYWNKFMQCVLHCKNREWIFHFFETMAFDNEQMMEYYCHLIQQCFCYWISNNNIEVWYNSYMLQLYKWIIQRWEYCHVQHNLLAQHQCLVSQIQMINELWEQHIPSLPITQWIVLECSLPHTPHVICQFIKKYIVYSTCTLEQVFASLCHSSICIANPLVTQLLALFHTTTTTVSMDWIGTILEQYYPILSKQVLYFLITHLPRQWCSSFTQFTRFCLQMSIVLSNDCLEWMDYLLQQWEEDEEWESFLIHQYSAILLTIKKDWNYGNNYSTCQQWIHNIGNAWQLFLEHSMLDDLTHVTSLYPHTLCILFIDHVLAHPQQSIRLRMNIPLYSHLHCACYMMHYLIEILLQQWMIYFPFHESNTTHLIEYQVYFPFQLTVQENQHQQQQHWILQWCCAWLEWQPDWIVLFFNLLYKYMIMQKKQQFVLLQCFSNHSFSSQTSIHSNSNTKVVLLLSPNRRIKKEQQQQQWNWWLEEEEQWIQFVSQKLPQHLVFEQIVSFENIFVNGRLCLKNDRKVDMGYTREMLQEEIEELRMYWFCNIALHYYLLKYHSSSSSNTTNQRRDVVVQQVVDQLDMYFEKQTNRILEMNIHSVDTNLNILLTKLRQVKK